MRFNKKILTIITLCTVITILLIVVVIFKPTKPSSNNSTELYGSEVDDGPGEEINEKSIFFKNRTLINNFVSNELSGILLEDIEELLLSSDEIALAPHKNQPTDGNSEQIYTASFNMGHTMGDSQDLPTYTVKMKVSDSREYRIYIRTDMEYGKTFVAMIVSDDNNKSTPRLYIHSGTQDYNNSIENWASTIVNNYVLKYSSVGYLDSDS